MMKEGLGAGAHCGACGCSNNFWGMGDKFRSNRGVVTQRMVRAARVNDGIIFGGRGVCIRRAGGRVDRKYLIYFTVNEITLEPLWFMSCVTCDNTNPFGFVCLGSPFCVTRSRCGHVTRRWVWAFSAVVEAQKTVSMAIVTIRRALSF